MIPQKSKSRIKMEKKKCNLVFDWLETNQINTKIKWDSTQYNINQTSMKEHQNQISQKPMSRIKKE